MDRLRTAFEGWPESSCPPVAPIAPRPLAGIEVHLVDRPNAAQTELRIGHAGPPRQHPDRVPLTVLNSALGGKFTSRINLNLRERHGFTYGAYSRFSDRRGPGPFQVSAAVGNGVAGAAAREAIAELARLHEEPLAADELEDTVRYLEGVFPYTLQTVDGIAARLAQLAVFDLPDDYFDRYQERLRAVTREQLSELAREHVHPDRLVVVAVGPAAELRAQLEPIGEIHELASAAR